MKRISSENHCCSDENIYKKIMERAKCSLEDAKKAHQNSRDNFEKAVELAKISSNNIHNLITITEYSNGILINKNQILSFHDFSNRKNLELKEMIQRSEFDHQILGEDCNSEIDVILEDMKDRKFISSEFIFDKKPCLEKNVVKIKQRRFSIIDVVLPTEIIFDENGCVEIVILYNYTQSVVCIIDSRRTVESIITKLEKIIGQPIFLYKRDDLIEASSSVSDLNNCIVRLTLSDRNNKNE